MKKIFSLVFLFSFFFVIRSVVFSHCEVPCGIYNDEMRFTMIEEHIQTIEKAMNQIMELSKQSPQNMNQIVRWIMNKEKHAEEIQHIISQYFLTQRIKAPDSKDKDAEESYITKLTLCHQILVLAMQAKQTTELEKVNSLKSALKQFKESYFGKMEHTHKD
jgi:nickel superoxide dismutase